MNKFDATPIQAQPAEQTAMPMAIPLLSPSEIAMGNAKDAVFIEDSFEKEHRNLSLKQVNPAGVSENQVKHVFEQEVVVLGEVDEQPEVLYATAEIVPFAEPVGTSFQESASDSLSIPVVFAKAYPIATTLSEPHWQTQTITEC